MLRRFQQGFSFLELVTVVALIGILLAVALPRLLPFIHEAERVAVRNVESELRAALVMAAAKRIAGGKSASIMSLARTNPMRILLETPSNYLGEFESPLLSGMPERSWYFDTRTQTLFYRAGEGLSDPMRSDMPPHLTYAVEVDWFDDNGDGRYSASVDELHGVRLVRIAAVGRFSLAASGR